MVDISSIDKIMMLNSELQQIDSALEIFDNNGRIVNLTVSSALGDPTARSSTVQTSSMEYPRQMTDAIINFLANREAEIQNELNSLGITGVDQPRR